MADRESRTQKKFEKRYNILNNYLCDREAQKLGQKHSTAGIR
jgi:hypothetical protein